MGTIYNPMILNSAVPGGSNPTGTNISVPTSSSPATGVSTPGSVNPYLASLNPSTPNPYASGIVPSSSPSSPTAPTTPSNPASSFPANSSPYGSGTIAVPGIATSAAYGGGSGPNGTQTETALTNTYGNLSQLVEQLLQSGGGYNAQAVQALLAQMQPGIAAGQQNLLQEFSAGGGRFSSGAELGLADYNSQVQLNEGDIMAQMYEQAYQNYMNEVMGVAGGNAQRLASQPSIWDMISSALGMGAQAGTSAYSTYQGGQNTAALAALLA